VSAVHVERLRLLALRPDASGRRLALPGRREARFEAGRLVIEKRERAARKAVSSPGA
jgi:hypothetical protein